MTESRRPANGIDHQHYSAESQPHERSVHARWSRMKRTRMARTKIDGRRPLLLVLLLLGGLGTLSACSEEPVGPTAEEVGQQFYEAVQRGDFAAAADLYIEEIPRQEIIAELERNREELGDLEDFRLKDTVVNTVFSGRRYILKYKTRYSKKHATEGLILFQPVSDRIVRIEMHNVRTRN